MPFFAKVRSLVRNLFLAGRVEAELDEEVRAHLEMLVVLATTIFPTLRIAKVDPTRTLRDQ